MTTPFGNPLTGGQGKLVRAVIQSPNFSITDKTGWAILKSGLAYFFDIILSGGTITGPDYIINSAGAFFYSGTPAAENLIASISAVNTTDGFGNQVIQGFTSYAPGVIAAQLFSGVLGFFSLDGHPFFSPPSVASTGDSLTGASLAVSSGVGTSGDTSADMNLFDSASSWTGAAAIGVDAPVQVQNEVWHNLALINGWTGAARYRLGAENRVYVDIQISSAAATAFQFGVMPAGYRPTGTKYIAAGSSNNVGAGSTVGNAGPFVQVLATGVINMEPLHAFSTAGTWVCGGSYPLD